MVYHKNRKKEEKNEMYYSLRIAFSSIFKDTQSQMRQKKAKRSKKKEKKG